VPTTQQCRRQPAAQQQTAWQHLGRITDTTKQQRQPSSASVQRLSFADQQQHHHQDHQAAAQHNEGAYLQKSPACDPMLGQPGASVKWLKSFQWLLPGQSILFRRLQLQSDGNYKEIGQQQPLQVVRLLGSGGSCEAYEVKDLSNSSCLVGSTPGAAAAAATAPDTIPLGNTGGNSSGNSSGMGRAHKVLKMPLRWDSVAEKPGYSSFAGDMDLNYRCVKAMLQEYELLTKLAGTSGITRCHGFGVAEFTTPSGCLIPARGLLLELSELGSLAQQLKLGSDSFAALSAAEAWQVMKDVTQALVSVHKAGFVYEDLKPASICSSTASGSLAYRLIDFGSCVMVQPCGMTVPQVVGGTTGYMAPEVEQQLPHMFNADTWSLGKSACLLYSLQPLIARNSIDEQLHLATARGRWLSQLCLHLDALEVLSAQCADLCCGAVFF
jgi:serine/threonine protein kinase